MTCSHTKMRPKPATSNRARLMTPVTKRAIAATSTAATIQVARTS